MKRAWSTLLSALFLLAVLAPTSAAAHDGRAFCDQVWGSGVKEGAASGTSALPHVKNVRTGQHDCFDRLVIDLDAGGYDYQVEYVDQVRRDGSGFVVPLRGEARLQVSLGAPAYDDGGRPTYSPTVPGELRDVSGYRTFRQVAEAGSFEGQTTIGLGVRARLPFRVLALAGPGAGTRLVIDVAHYWFEPHSHDAIAPSGQGAGQPFCGITWGSLDKAADGAIGHPLTDVRTGQHECFDRVVIDFDAVVVDGVSHNGPVFSHVAYAPALATIPGDVIPLRGGAVLVVHLGVSDGSPEGARTYDPSDPNELADVGGYRTFRQVAIGPTFEGETDIGIGVRARLPFRSFWLPGPGPGGRLVVDVAHGW